MKKLLALIALTFLAFVAADQPLKVQGKLNDWNKHISKLELIRKIADESNLNNQEVKFITKTIDSLELFIVPQLQRQLTDTTKQK